MTERLDATSPTPLYHQLYLLLAAQIAEGELGGGGFVPSERDLAERFAVSRITAKRALDELAANGLVSREAGRGTRIRRDRHTPAGAIPVAGGPAAEPLGADYAARVLLFARRPARAPVAHALGLAEGDEVLQSVRVLHAGDRPFCHLATFVPVALGERWTADDLATTPMAHLLERAGVPPVRVREQVTATLADLRTAAPLDVAVGSPLLKTYRSSFDRAGRVVSHTVGLFVPERYVYEATG